MSDSWARALLARIRSSQVAQGALLLAALVGVLAAWSSIHDDDPETGAFVTVEVAVTGSASGALLTIDSGGETSQRDITIPNTTPLFLASGDVVSMSVQNAGATGDLTCEVTVHGVSLSTSSSDAAYGIAACSARVP